MVFKHNILGSISILSLLTILWGYALFFAVPEKHQGDVYRILYVHVPSAAAAFLISGILFIQGIISIKKPWSSLLFMGKALGEAGLIFTLLTLVTGSLWGRPTWGVWWTWDARITTTFLLALLYGGYLLVWNHLDSTDTKAKVCGVLGILIAVDVPIIYQSVTWWRTLHQPPSIIRSGGSTMDPEILLTLLACTAATIAVAGWMIAYRTHILKLHHEIHYQALGEFT